MSTADDAWLPRERWRPEDDTLDLWRFELTAQPGDIDRLSEDERARADRLIIPSKRDQFIAGRSLLREILSRYVGGRPDELRFGYEEHGKPFLDVASGGPTVSFNLTHSHVCGVLGVTAHRRIGVDVEHCRPGRAFEAIAERFFSDPEIDVLMAAPPHERPRMFYRAWAQKEAYLKAWGTGLTFSSRRFTVTMHRDRPAAVVSTQMPDDDPERWNFVDLDVGPQYAAAVCWEDTPLRLRRFMAR